MSVTELGPFESMLLASRPRAKRVTVATSGTRVAANASQQTVLGCVCKADVNNTGIIYVGGSDVVATAGAAQGFPLKAGESVPVPINDLAELYFDASVNGQSVHILYGLMNRT